MERGRHREQGVSHLQDRCGFLARTETRRIEIAGHENFGAVTFTPPHTSDYGMCDGSPSAASISVPIM